MQHNDLDYARLNILGQFTPELPIEYDLTFEFNREHVFQLSPLLI